MALMRFDPFRELDRLAEQATVRGDLDDVALVGDTHQGQQAIQAESNAPQTVDA